MTGLYSKEDSDTLFRTIVPRWKYGGNAQRARETDSKCGQKSSY